MKNTTINDIAKEAGVSKATVSRVLNNTAFVEPETKERVLDVVKRRHYVPSATARNLSKQVSSMVGVIVPDVANPFFGQIFRGIIDILDQHELTIFCSNTDDLEHKDTRALDLMRVQRVRGLIYDPAVDYSEPKDRKKLLRTLKDLNVPVVLIDRDISLNHDGIFFNDYKGIYESTTALLEQGHKEIAIINGMKNNILTTQRQQGYLDALRDAGVEARPEYTYYGDYTEKKAYQSVKHLLTLERQPTAVITCNNLMSKGFLRAIHEEGKVLHKDYEHVGLDELDMLNILGIPYNYIKRDSYELGKRAAEVLIERMLFPERPLQKIVLDAPVIRQTI